MAPPLLCALGALEGEDGYKYPTMLSVPIPDHFSPFITTATQSTHFLINMQFTNAIIAAITLFAMGAAAETHTITFNNKCGSGTPTLVQNGKILSTGNPYTANGQFNSFIAYLQTGSCGLNGEQCTLVEGSLQNTGFSSADISLVPPHKFSKTSGFVYTGGDGSCNGKGEDCKSGGCPGAFTNATNGAIIQCSADNIGLEITFCA